MKQFYHMNWGGAWSMMLNGFAIFSPSLAIVIRYDAALDAFLRRDHSNRDSEWSYTVPDSKFFSADDWISMSMLEREKQSA